MKYIYQLGKTNVETSVHQHEDGVERAQYSADRRNHLDPLFEQGVDFPVDEYLAILNFNKKPEEAEFVCLTSEELQPLWKAANEAKYVKPWKEITEEQWDEMLNVLPPKNWRTVGGVNIFQMSEYMTDNITQHFARVGGKFFSCYSRDTVPYAELAEQVKKLLA